MSADNWTTCPKCGGEFREDWEICGADEGVVEIEYHGRCRQCGAQANIFAAGEVRRLGGAS